MEKSFLTVNIPADGLFLAILNHANGDFSKENCEKIICEYIGQFLAAEPDMIFLNVCYRRSLTPSKIFDSYLYNIETDEDGYAIKEQGESIKEYSPVTKNVSKYFMSFIVCARELLKNDIDIYKFAINRIKQTKCRVFLSVRMNDAHYIGDPAINSSFALKNGGEHTIHRDGAHLDYSQKAVQNYYYSYIQELLQNYQVDGIELDWLRYPTVLPPQKCFDYHILNDYMKKIRRLINVYDDHAALAVRMLPTEEKNLEHGFDVCGWIADGNVDILTIENFYIPTNFELPIAQWRSSIEKRNTKNNPYCLLCGADWGVSCVPHYYIAMTPALVRGFTDTCLTGGADGVYLFNFFEENDDSSFEFVSGQKTTGHLENCFLERIKAANESECLPRRYVHIGSSDDRYPISLSSKNSYTFVKTINSPYKTVKCVVGCDKDVSLTVYANDRFVGVFKKQPVCFGFEHISEEDISKEHRFIYAVSQAAPFVGYVCLPDDIAEKRELKITIENTLCNEVKLLWLELVCE